MKILAFAASLRRASLNRRLIEVAVGLARQEGAEVDLAEFREFDMPLYDGDLQEKSGLPPGAQELQRRIEAVDALLISVPEYNYSIPGTLKNAIDWVSRARPIPWRGRSIYLMAASPSPMGGIRGLWQTRIPLEGCGALVFPDMFALPNADEAFDEQGALKQPKVIERLQKDIAGFVRLAEAASGVCRGQAGPGATSSQAKVAAALEAQSEIQGARAAG